VLTTFFHHDGFLDLVVAPDAVAGFILVRVEQRAALRKVQHTFKHESFQVALHSPRYPEEGYIPVLGHTGNSNGYGNGQKGSKENGNGVSLRKISSPLNTISLGMISWVFVSFLACFYFSSSWVDCLSNFLRFLCFALSYYYLLPCLSSLLLVIYFFFSFFLSLKVMVKKTISLEPDHLVHRFILIHVNKLLHH
jgi:hypothetical protein